MALVLGLSQVLMFSSVVTLCISGTIYCLDLGVWRLLSTRQVEQDTRKGVNLAPATERCPMTIRYLQVSAMHQAGRAANKRRVKSLEFLPTCSCIDSRFHIPFPLRLLRSLKGACNVPMIAHHYWPTRSPRSVAERNALLKLLFHNIMDKFIVGLCK